MECHGRAILDQVLQEALPERVVHEQGPEKCWQIIHAKLCGKSILGGRKRGPGAGKPYKALQRVGENDAERSVSPLLPSRCSSYLHLGRRDPWWGSHHLPQGPC